VLAPPSFPGRSVRTTSFLPGTASKAISSSLGSGEIDSLEELKSPMAVISSLVCLLMLVSKLPQTSGRSGKTDYFG
jgi:hypothetical protein